MGPGGVVRLAVVGEPVDHAEVVSHENRGELFAWLVGRSRQRVGWLKANVRRGSAESGRREAEGVGEWGRVMRW